MADLFRHLCDVGKAGQAADALRNRFVQSFESVFIAEKYCDSVFGAAFWQRALPDRSPELFDHKKRRFGD